MTGTGGEDAPRVVGRLRVAGPAGLVTLVAYLGFLGWDQTEDVRPDGSVTGPYRSWQVAGLVFVLATTAAVAGWRRRPWVAAVVTAIVMTGSWSIDAATDPPPTNDGLWPVGAVLVAVGTFAGMALVARLSMALAGGRLTRAGAPRRAGTSRS